MHAFGYVLHIPSINFFFLLNGSIAIWKLLNSLLQELVIDKVLI